MSTCKISPDDWLRAVAATDDRPAVREVADDALAELRRLRRIEDAALVWRDNDREYYAGDLVAALTPDDER